MTITASALRDHLAYLLKKNQKIFDFLLFVIVIFYLWYLETTSPWFITYGKRPKRSTRSWKVLQDFFVHFGLFFISINSQISRFTLVVLIVSIVRTWLVVWPTACLSHAQPSEVRLTINTFLLFLFCFDNKKSRNDRKNHEKLFHGFIDRFSFPGRFYNPLFIEILTEVPISHSLTEFNQPFNQ